MSDKDKAGGTRPGSRGRGLLASRRRFTRAGAATPILMSLASRPVWGAQCSVSGMLSGPKSGEEPVLCAGCTPGFWKNNPEVWPAPTDPGDPQPGEFNLMTGDCERVVGGGNNCTLYAANGTTFNDVFGAGAAESLGLVYAQNDDPPGSVIGAPLTLMHTLQLVDKGPANHNETVGAHLVAAFMNAASFPDQYGYTALQVMDWVLYGFPPGMTEIDLVMLNERGCPLGANPGG